MDALHDDGARAEAVAKMMEITRACANTAAETDWEQILLLFAALLQASSSPIGALNRAVAVGMAQGPGAGLQALDAFAAEPAQTNYHLLHSVRGDQLVKLGRYAEAREELQRAIAKTKNRRENELLSKKRKQAMFID
jgi:RNA polymerase sigma-70 factor (ECF subfamily)